MTLAVLRHCLTPAHLPQGYLGAQTGTPWWVCPLQKVTYIKGACLSPGLVPLQRNLIMIASDCDGAQLLHPFHDLDTTGGLR